jgi:hypothetical protein
MQEKIPPLSSKQLEPLLIPITDIHPHPDNYKIHNVDQLRSLKASLKTFSWTTPIKANLEGTIIAGHGMYQAALEEGYTHVPVEFCALDKQLSKAYLVADNETARKAETDKDQLNSLLSEISEIPDFDIEATGFSLEDLDSCFDIEKNSSNIVGKALTILVQGIEIIDSMGNIVLVDCQVTNDHKIHEFCRIEGSTIEFMGEYGETTKYKMRVIDESMNPYIYLCALQNE